MRKPAPFLLLTVGIFAPQILHAQSAPESQSVIRYHYGDNPAWSAPSFDDSSWPDAADGEIPAPPFYSDGFVWVRVHLRAPAEAGGTLGLRQKYPENAPSAEELYVNGVMIGQSGGTPPRPVAEIVLQPSVFALPTGLVGRGGVAVVAMRGWEQPSHRLRRDELLFAPGERLSFAVDRLSVLATAAQNEQLVTLAKQLPILLPQFVLVLIGFALLVLWRWWKRRELAMFGIVLLSGNGYLLFMLISLAGFVPLSVHQWLLLWALPQFLSPAMWVLFFWTVMTLPDHFWKRTAIGSLVASVAFGCVALWACEPSPLVAFCFRKYVWGFHLMSSIYLCAVAWQVLARRNNRLLAIAMCPASLFDLLGSVIRLPPVRLGFLTTSYFAIGLTVSGFAVVVLLLQRTWQDWQESNGLRIEFAAAREVQQQLVPLALPKVPGMRFEAAYLPAAEVGGDFYQLLPQPGGSHLVVIGDVSGKGLKAAMTGSVVLGALRSLSQEDLSPSQILTRLNDQLTASSDGGFITCLAARIAADGTLTLANAGHLAPYRNGEEVPLDSGLPLGVTGETIYLESTLHLGPGDTLTFLSDGVVEAQSPSGELFGFDRTTAISTQSAEEIAQAAQAFGPQDDITVLTLQFAPGEVIHA